MKLRLAWLVPTFMGVGASLITAGWINHEAWKGYVVALAVFVAMTAAEAYLIFRKPTGEDVKEGKARGGSVPCPRCREVPR